MKIEDLPRFVVDYLLEEVFNNVWRDTAKYQHLDFVNFKDCYYSGRLYGDWVKIETDMLQELAKENALEHLQNCANVIVMPETIQELTKLHKFINHEN